jgi:hypothetical protein
MDRLRVRRAPLLVESKFYEQLNEWEAPSGEDCLSRIISGGERRPSRFSDPELHTLHSSFDADGHFKSHEIDELIEYARATLANLTSTVAPRGRQTEASLKSSVVASARAAGLGQVKAVVGAAAKKPTNAAALLQRRASNLVKKAAQTSILKQTTAGDKNGGEAAATVGRDRKKSASSNSSESSSFKNVNTKQSQKIVEKPLQQQGNSANF